MPARTDGAAVLVGLGRRWWRQLTSMRTALVLLFLLAVAAVPGSVLPQRNLGEEKVVAYRAENPQLARWLERLGMFEVYASPWFAAIYLLLMTSLVGCLLPRLREHARALRPDGSVIPGLFATGNVASAVMGRSYAGAGATISPAMTFGYIAANFAADQPGPTADPTSSAGSRRG